MYQFYYTQNIHAQEALYKKKASDVFEVTAVRPTMWEEHCLECAAPLCYGNCLHYEARMDGRCKRFFNGLSVRRDAEGCCGQAVRVKFRKWANMMTVLFPAMLPLEDAQSLTDRNQKLGEKLDTISHSSLPVKLKWESIRTAEYLRRRRLRKLKGLANRPDAFLFHGYSFENKPFHLFVEIYDDHTSVYKTSILIHPGENLCVLKQSAMTSACWTKNYLVKVYPENDLEAELDIRWCDFVQGKSLQNEVPAKTVKCVVWDLDNTMWDGTLIETEDVHSLRPRAGVVELIKALDERGIIQSIASKNDYDAAWRVVEGLGLSEYFLYPQIHWNAKSGSMQQIAESLNIGIDSLALIDDSVFEREQVHSVLPQVRTYDAALIGRLLSCPEFAVVITEESRNRRAMYRAEEKRNQFKSVGNMDATDFLRECNLRIHIFSPNTDAERLRCYELVVRTNQLNLSGKKYTQEEFEAVLQRPEHQNFAFSCADDFGEYGIVGFGQYRICAGEIIFTEFAMSCRAAGKYVESAMFAAILSKENCGTGRFAVQKTQKNSLLRRTLDDIGFAIQAEDNKMIDYCFTSDLKNKDLVSVM